MESLGMEQEVFVPCSKKQLDHVQELITPTSGETDELQAGPVLFRPVKTLADRFLYFKKILIDNEDVELVSNSQYFDYTADKEIYPEQIIDDGGLKIINK